MNRIFPTVTLIFLLTSCSISYSFKTASIDYELTKTIAIDNFINQSPLVYAPLEQQFNEELKEYFTRNTKLSLVENNGDLELEGEIVEYTLTPLAVQEDAFASETKLTMTVNIRYRNNKTDEPDIEQRISADRTFSSNTIFDSVQDELNAQLVKQIVEQIFNATLGNW